MGRSPINDNCCDLSSRKQIPVVKREPTYSGYKNDLLLQFILDHYHGQTERGHFMPINASKR